MGCYEKQNSESNFYQLNGSVTLSTYKCIEACAHGTFPLAAVLNDTQCHCANDSVIPLINPDPFGSPDAGRTFLLYNTSCLSAAFVELYQELTFTTFSSKITPSVSSPVTLVTPSSVTASNSSKSMLYFIDFGDGRSNKTWREESILRHRYVTTGEFNITFVASRGSSTVFVLSRKIRVISRLQVTGLWCPAVKPFSRFGCNLYYLGGSNVTASISLNNTGQTVSLTVPGMTRHGIHM